MLTVRAFELFYNLRVSFFQEKGIVKKVRFTFINKNRNFTNQGRAITDVLFFEKPNQFVINGMVQEVVWPEEVATAKIDFPFPDFLK